MRSLLITSKMPTVFWEDALLYACYLSNIVPHSAINNEIPYEIINKKKPDYNILRIWGCLEEIIRKEIIFFERDLLKNYPTVDLQFWDTENLENLDCILFPQNDIKQIDIDLNINNENENIDDNNDFKDNNNNDVEIENNENYSSSSDDNENEQIVIFLI
ncbi:hypothetical protein U3516DRAFT_658129 [Neocallimastix sp. 'constans']